MADQLFEIICSTSLTDSFVVLIDITKVDDVKKHVSMLIFVDDDRYAEINRLPSMVIYNKSNIILFLNRMSGYIHIVKLILSSTLIKAFEALEVYINSCSSMGQSILKVKKTDDELYCKFDGFLDIKYEEARLFKDLLKDDVISTAFGSAKTTIIVEDYGEQKNNNYDITINKF